MTMIMVTMIDDDVRALLYTCLLCFRDDEDDEGRSHVTRGRQTGVSFSDHDVEQSATTTSRPERSGKPSLMSFPSLEHLDRMADGSPWRSTTRRRRKFRGGIGGLRRRHDEATEPTDDVNDDIELDRVTDVETVPDTSRRPARTASSVSRTASAAARQREKQQLANHSTQPLPEPENRIYRPAVKRPQPLPPAPLAPRLPAPVDRDALRVTEEPNVSADGETSEPAASKPRRQRRRRQRGEGDVVSQTSTVPLDSATASEPRVHQPHNGARNVSRDTSTDVSVKTEPQDIGSGHRRSSRRSADPRGARRTDARVATFV